MLRKALERVLEFPAIYNLNQMIGQPTVRRYVQLVSEEIPVGAEMSVVDIGCGTGASRAVINARYHGIDINPSYIEAARRNHADADFTAMDGTKLIFADDSFDQAMSIATTHHLDDSQLQAMTAEALRVVRPGGAFHIIDAILPMNPRELFKERFFRMDRGRFPRRLDELQRVVSYSGHVARQRVLNGPLHDVAYLRLVPLAAAGAKGAV
ncbi:class I SAM-dependent methyltransferase [Bradyrhizobium lablabi]|uniref:class I SAM-dependent methyltransferase n=1 Tax=Bradyrhizobium lablabi TaxID=722472 RepID=UPI001BADAFD2|nr:class I SAM-dependent methyltransferase [Bradyrhizobium lablabi]MBR0695280.1 class I SAM-dependent methyltransferase [Bradyrhizobium lablabi]